MALNRREKLLLGGLAFMGVALAGYTLVHEPLTARRAEAHERLEKVELELLQEQKRLAKEGDLFERKARVAAREQVIDSWVPGKNSAALLIWHLAQAEQLSGARIRGIRVGEKSVVSVDGKSAGQTGQAPAGQAGGQVATGQAASEQAPAGQAPSGTKEQAQGSAQAAATGAMSTLVSIPLEIQLDGRFATHLIFNQYLEDAPLFLATHGIALARRGQVDMDKVGQLVQGGNPWLAEQILRESPPVDGLYRLNLYFKADKPGPSTDEMHFDSQPGRIDPFVMDAVDEFIRWLQAYFAGLEPPEGAQPPADGGGRRGPPQLG